MKEMTLETSDDKGGNVSDHHKTAQQSNEKGVPCSVTILSLCLIKALSVLNNFIKWYSVLLIWLYC